MCCLWVHKHLKQLLVQDIAKFVVHDTSLLAKEHNNQGESEMWEASVTVGSEASCRVVYPTARLNTWSEKGQVR